MIVDLVSAVAPCFGDLSRDIDVDQVVALAMAAGVPDIASELLSYNVAQDMLPELGGRQSNAVG